MENENAADEDDIDIAIETGSGSETGVTLEQVLEAVLIASPEPVSAAELAAKLHGAAKAARDEERERIEEELGASGQADGDGDGDGDGEGDASGVRDALRKAQKARPETAFAKVTADEVTAALGRLAESYRADGRSFTVLERAGGWKIFTRGEFATWVRQLYPEKKPERLSGPAMETLAIIAYRQPVTKAAIEAVRGVSCDGVLQKLLDRNVVRIAGRAELPGRPLLYETTDLFFEHFGIRSVDDLPNAAELRAVPLPEPETEAEPETDPEDGAESESESESETGDGEGGEVEVEVEVEEEAEALAPAEAAAEETEKA